MIVSRPDRRPEAIVRSVVALGLWLFAAGACAGDVPVPEQADIIN